MNKKTLYGKEARAAVLAGLNKIADAVVTTLGPAGRNVLISESVVVDYSTRNLPISVTKDGYRTTQAFQLQDPFESVGVTIAKECAQKTVNQAGDGTSSTILLLRAMVKRGVELVDNGANPMELKRSLDKAVEYVVSELKKMATPIKGDIEKIRQIATISGNNDPEIGEWIAKAFEKIGEDGVIDLEPSSGVTTEIKISDGYKWNNGWGSTSPYFINQPDKQICEFENPLILLYEKTINHNTQIETAIRLSLSAGRPLLIVCEDVKDHGLSFLAMNTIQKNIQCCVVKAPAFGNERRLEMEDIAMLTGGTYISDSKGIDIKKVTLGNLGKAKKVVVSKDDTVIIGGVADASSVTNVLNELKMNLAQAKNEDEKAPIEKRIAKITGGVAVIQVGAATETEMKEKMDRFDDSVRAVKAAISEGFVCGAGTAFLRIPIPVEEMSGASGLLYEVLQDPLVQICKNAGIEDVAGTVKRVCCAAGNIGYNAKTDKIEDLVLSGIIDPVKVLRCALQNSASSAGMILTSEVIIADYLN